MAAFGQQPETSDRNYVVIHIDVVTQYRAGIYIGNNEAVW